MYQRYAPHETYMKNVVRGYDRPIRRKRMPSWLRMVLSAFALLILSVAFFGAMFIIAEVVAR